MKGSMMTNKLILTAPQITTTDSQLAYQQPQSQASSVQFGPDAMCVRIEGHQDASLNFVTSSGQVLAAFETGNGKTTLTVDNLKINQHLELSDGALTIGGRKQWRLAMSEAFTMGQIPQGWDTTMDIVSSCAGVVMMGGYGKFSQGEISKVYTDLPPHTYLRVVANFHFIDNWTGDSGFMRVDAGKDGSLIHVWTDSHKVQSSKGVNLCGKVTVPETKFSVPIDVAFPHSSPALKVAFGSTMQTSELSLPTLNPLQISPKRRPGVCL